MSMTLLAALAAVAVGVDVGWQPAEDGGLEYIIQIEPHKLKMLQAGDTISVGVRPELRDVRCYRIVIGDEELPRSDETLQHSLKTTRNPTATPQIAGPYCPVDESESSTEKSVDGTRDESRNEKSIWTAAPSPDAADDKAALQPPTLTLSPPASNSRDRWERTESAIRQPSSEAALDAGRAAVGRAENNWAQSDTAAGATRPDTVGGLRSGDPYNTPRLEGQPRAAMPPKMADNTNRLVPLGNDPPATQLQPTIPPASQLQPTIPPAGQLQRTIPPAGQPAEPPPQTGGRYGEILSGPAANNPPRPADQRYDWPAVDPYRQPAGATSPAVEPSPVVAGDTAPGVAPRATRSSPAGNRGPRLTPTAPGDLQIVAPPARRPVQFSTDPDVIPAVRQTRTAPTMPPSEVAGNAVVSSPAAVDLAATGIDKSLPANAAPANTAGGSTTTPNSAEPESRPWLALTLCLAALFASLGGNLYLGWMTLDIRRRFQQLAYRTRKATDADPLEDVGRRRSEGRSYA